MQSLEQRTNRRYLYKIDCDLFLLTFSVFTSHAARAFPSRYSKSQYNRNDKLKTLIIIPEISFRGQQIIFQQDREEKCGIYAYNIIYPIFGYIFCFLQLMVEHSIQILDYG